MKKSFFEKLKNMFKKIKFNPLGGGVLLLISLSLFSGGFASFLISDDSLKNELNGAISVGTNQSYIEKIEIKNTFTICQDGFLFSDGSISRQGNISYDVYVDKTLVPSSMVYNNLISFVFVLTDSDGYFISNNSTNVFEYSIVANNIESATNTIVDSSLNSSIINLDIDSFDEFFSLSFNFTITDVDTFYSDIYSNYLNMLTPTFSLLIKGVNQNG